MKPTKEQKREVARQMAELFRKSGHLYFTRYQGLKFVELAELRKRLRSLACGYRVIKNRLVGHALKEAGITGGSEGLLRGPVGLLLGGGADPAASARILAGFAKEFPLLKVQAGYVDGQWLDSMGCATLATLGTKPELLASLAGALYGALAQGASVLQAPIRDLALVLKAVQDKKGG